jgi:hypothetical protein
MAEITDVTPLTTALCDARWYRIESVSNLRRWGLIPGRPESLCIEATPIDAKGEWRFMLTCGGAVVQYRPTLESVERVIAVFDVEASRA